MNMRLYNNKTPKNKATLEQMTENKSLNEQIKIIRTNIEFVSMGQSKVYILTSSLPGEGKSTIISNLAIAFSQQNKKVLLIDGDMRRPTQAKLFQRLNHTGLSTLLANQSTLKDTIQTIEKYNIDFIPSGPVPPNPTDLLSSPRLEKVLETCREMYDFIFIDTPPLIDIADGPILASKVDGTFLVVRAYKTYKTEIQKSVQILKQSNAKIMGYILNDVKRQGQSKNYYVY
ncbi:CpsD/CapB family tyrosine-protein kinase [Listeria booriae]|uniref:non-specific protein-tyrosine kinase n=1 Tax=Listeria booriae TaxID=1552123 RepID=A0A7X1DJ77_9LIST|nr:CpsD/CapB family tyrosine-protein kinase [Listeria booriae]MBC2304046.1 CpsD/CapB family tyrosine-protein kinase [Listeria booriae]MBC2309701.1 CpsD/CapB family tyrosine-protein kinase [Listeria booriae]